MAMFNLPEENFCPNLCVDKGGFVKAYKTPKKVMDKPNANYAQGLVETARQYQQLQNQKQDFIIAEQTKSNSRKDIQCLPSSNDKVDWSPLGGLTGTRPNVSKHSSNRYSLDEWRNNNAAVLDREKINESNILQYSSQMAAMTAFGNIDKAQQANNERLKQRAKVVFKWKVEVEQTCKAITKEVELLEIQRQRIITALKVLMLPESICKECIELRSNRAEVDLVEDLPELKLRKEMEMIIKVKEIFNTAMLKTEEQLVNNRAAKNNIEYDWCDKTTAYNTETVNLGLNNNSSTLLFIPGATKFSDHTSPLMYYEYYCKENIVNVEAVRQASADWRNTLNAILIDNANKLRLQADKTDIALAETIVHTTELLTNMEEHQRHTIKSLYDIKQLIQNLQSSIRKTDAAMKLAQTRLDNRNSFRPHRENVRDPPHSGLLKEVKIIHENVTSLITQLRKAEKSKKDLIEKRKEIEKNITFKKKALAIDRERCGMIRSHYPPASALAGL